MSISCSCDNCTICGDNIDVQEKHTLECEHAFHTHCIVEWFRRGNMSCPLCRSEKLLSLRPINSPHRIVMLKRESKKRHAPPCLILKVAQYRNALVELKEIKKEYREFKKYNKLIWQQQSRIMAKMRRRSINVSRRFNELREYAHPSVNVPLLTESQESDTDSSSLFD